MSNAPYTVDQHTLIWGLFRQIKSTFWIEYFGLKVMFNTRFLAVIEDLNACNFISYQNGFYICKHSRVMCNLQLQCPTHPTFPYNNNIDNQGGRALSIQFLPTNLNV